ncbi:SMI1/KNR4 family protein [Plantactinospora sp. GCM10030261]|uniref:SMI1/KNR4 family protein n=1 Tax=Plantactinospora sp. GCM10030261 TaxID=3273420 RepID=UPI0036210C8A
MTGPDPTTVLPGGGLAMSVVHPGPPALRVRYREGVLMTPAGHPDWPLCARAVVELPPPPAGLSRDEVRVVDVLAANLVTTRAAREPDGDPLFADTDPFTTPAGWCWAHQGGARQVALVPIELHGVFRHAGAVATLPVGGRGLRGAGAGAIRPAVGDPVPEEILDTLERVLGWPLPDRYRAFLAATNGAGPAAPGVLPGFGFIADQPLFGIARDDRFQDLSYVVGLFRDRFTVDYLPVGYVQGGLLVVKVSGDDLDSVWYWDDDDPRDRDAYDAEVICAELLHRCADSMDDLWARLVAVPEPLAALADSWLVEGLAREVRDEFVGAGLPPRAAPPWQPAERSAADPLVAMFEAR